MGTVSFNSKNVDKRTRAKRRIRRRIAGSEERPRLSIFKSARYTYVQLIDDVRGVTLASASSLEKTVMERVAEFDVAAYVEKAEAEGASFEPRSKSSKSIAAAWVVGEVLAERGVAKGISAVVFDRNGFRYAGRVAAAADGARSKGLQF